MRLQGKVAIITGSSRGIGYSTAKCFVEQGASVVINGRDPTRTKEAAASLNSPSRTTTVCGDVADVKTGEALLQAALENFGKIDILVCNAGITKGDRVTEIDQEVWKAILETNISGTYFCIRAVLPKMMEQQSGVICTLSSIYYRGSKGQLHYDTSKGAIVSMTRSLALELAKYNIRVNCVAPGLIDTDMPKTIPDPVLKNLIAQIPFRRLGRPEEVAAGIAFLVSDSASFITGQVLHINGGSFLGG